MFIVMLKLVLRIQSGKKITWPKWNRNSGTHSISFISNFPNYDPRSRLRLLQRVCGLCKALYDSCSVSAFNWVTELNCVQLHSIVPSSYLHYQQSCQIGEHSISTRWSGAARPGYMRGVTEHCKSISGQEIPPPPTHTHTNTFTASRTGAQSWKKHPVTNLAPASWLLPINVSVLLASASYWRPWCSAYTPFAFFEPCIVIFIHSLVFKLRGRADRNQSPVMWPIWLWHTASWASSWG